MNEDMNEQEAIQLSGQEAFLRSDFTISSHSHQFSVTMLLQRIISASFISAPALSDICHPRGA